MAKKTFNDQAQELRSNISPKEVAPVAKLAGVSPRWIRYFIDGTVPNPGVQTLDKLVAGLAAYRKGKRHGKDGKG